MILRRAATLVLICAALVAAAGAWWVHSLGSAPLGADIAYSTLAVDREGRLLRPYATPEGRWRLPVALDEVDPRYVRMLIAYEDRRFREHRGVDPLAMLRAAWQFAANGRIVSGGSTSPCRWRGCWSRGRTLAWRQAPADGARAPARARAEQGRHSRALSQSRAVRRQSRRRARGALAYFGKEPRRLSLGEAALLVALPQSPELRGVRIARRGRAKGARPRARPDRSRPAAVPPTRRSLAKRESGA
jgi:penicillin-binding protein 1C